MSLPAVRTRWLVALALLSSFAFAPSLSAQTIFDAARGGDAELVHQLLASDPQLTHATDDDGCTALHHAASRGHFEVTTVLLDGGAEIDARSSSGQTALLFAAAGRHVDAARTLLSKGADVNAMTDHGWTPLSMAALCNTEITEFLLSKGANPNPHEIAEKEDCACAGSPTPLHLAVRHDSLSTVKVLVEHGALVNITDENGMTPLHVAVNNSNLSIVDYLTEKGAYLNLRDEKYGRLELHTAAIRGNGDIVNRLVKGGANVSAQDNDGMTPLDYAHYHGFDQIADYLKAHDARAASNKPLASAMIKDLKVKDREAVVWYLGHSAWAIKTCDHLLVFDYSKNPARDLPTEASLASGYVIPSEIKDENVTVFVSHHHGDHYDPRVFEWRNELSDIEYVFGFQPRDIEGAYTYIGPRGERSIGDMKVHTIRSNDAGVGFLIEVDGLTILHPGDHANGNMDLSGNYTPEIDALATMTENDIDLAFFAILGCSLGTPESVQLGVHYAIEHLRPKVAFPMHAGHAPYFYREFVEGAAEYDYDTQLAYALNEGDRFQYKQGKVTKIE